MKISVIIPVYNVERYLEACLESVARQTFTDFEVLIVDDCGKDGSMAIAENFVTSYSGPIRWRILHHEHNRGLSAARNTGIDASEGEYLYFLDSDDWISDDCLESLYTEVSEHPGVQMVMGAIDSRPHKSFYDWKYFDSPVYVGNNDWVRYNFFKTGEEFPVVAWNKLVHAAFLKKNGLYFKEGLVNEDQLWTFKVSLVLESVATVANRTYIHITDDPTSIMSTTTADKRFRNMLIIIRDILPSIRSRSKMMDLALFKYAHMFYANLKPELINRDTVRTSLSFAREFFRFGYRRFALKSVLDVIYTSLFHSVKWSEKLARCVWMEWKALSQKETI